MYSKHVCDAFLGFVLQDSLAAEIEGTMRKELSLDDPECEEQKYEMIDSTNS